MNQLNNDYIFSVSELNSLIKELFDNTPLFKNLTLKGELSNWKGKNISGHIYFSLKDNTSTIKCVMFKYDTYSLNESFNDGDKVIIKCSLSSYVPSGTYQLIVKSIVKEGVGEILLEKKILIDKLNKEGLFDKSHKKELPLIPNNIGIIVGKNSAASKDLEYNIIRRWPLITINFYYSLVQGMDASNDLIDKINLADNDNNDVLIIARGGGSQEDLSAFDNEELARTIYKAKTPIISAVGHEINKSVTDLISDKYASTPTGAAELVVPDKNEVLKDLNMYKDQSLKLINSTIKEYSYRLEIIKNNKKITNISFLYDEINSKIVSQKEKTDLLMNNYLNSLKNNINHKKEILNAYNPSNLLEKGYCIIKDDNNKVIKSSKELKDNSDNKIVFKDKEIKVKIKRY